jgi:fido (protein-threonine AMPylation protein)
MQDLEDESWLVGLPEDKFVDRLAHYYCEINVLHPFRIGSGLAQRIFFEQLAIHAGYVLTGMAFRLRSGIRLIRAGRWVTCLHCGDIS